MSKSDGKFTYGDGVTLRDLVMSKFEGNDKATQLAYDSMNKRLEGMNEFRDQLKDQASRFITRDEFGIITNRLIEDIRELREGKARLEGKADQSSVNKAFTLSIIGLVVALVSLLTRVIIA